MAWWNVYDRTTNDEPRTNNSDEADHRRFQSELNMSHPSLWRFINILRRTQKARDLEYHQLEAGAQPTAKKPKYVRLDARLRTMVLDYENIGLQLNIYEQLLVTCVGRCYVLTQVRVK